MAIATLADEAMGAVRSALRAVDDAMESLGKHRARMYGLLERLEADRDGTKAEVDREEWRHRALAAEASLDRLKALADALDGNGRSK